MFTQRPQYSIEFPLKQIAFGCNAERVTNVTVVWFLQFCFSVVRLRQPVFKSELVHFGCTRKTQLNKSWTIFGNGFTRYIAKTNTYVNQGSVKAFNKCNFKLNFLTEYSAYANCARVTPKSSAQPAHETTGVAKARGRSRARISSLHQLTFERFFLRFDLCFERPLEIHWLRPCTSLPSRQTLLLQTAVLFSSTHSSFAAVHKAKPN